MSTCCELCNLRVVLSKIESHSSFCEAVEVACPLALLGEECDSCTGKVKRKDEVAHLGPNGARFLAIIERERRSRVIVVEPTSDDQNDNFPAAAINPLDHINGDEAVMTASSLTTAESDLIVPSHPEPTGGVDADQIGLTASKRAVKRKVKRTMPWLIAKEAVSPVIAFTVVPCLALLVEEDIEMPSSTSTVSVGQGVPGPASIPKPKEGRGQHMKRKAALRTASAAIGVDGVSSTSRDDIVMDSASKAARVESAQDSTSSSMSGSLPLTVVPLSVDPVVEMEVELVATEPVSVNRATAASAPIVTSNAAAATIVRNATPSMAFQRVYTVVKQNRRWASEGVYSGDLLNGKRDGEGRMEFTSHPYFGKCEYEGQWRNDRIQGHGTLKYKANYEDITYTGSFVDGEMTGDGRIQYPESDVYTGQVSNGYPSGFGTMLYGNGANMKHGRGQYTWASAGRSTNAGNIYEGDFVMDRIEGQGRLTYFAKNSLLNEYIGAFVNGLAEGEGKGLYADGNVFDGNARRGACVMKWVDGSVFEGQWAPQATITNPDHMATYCNAEGVECEGKWVSGDLVFQALV
eukprot:gene30936-38235_t